MNTSRDNPAIQNTAIYVVIAIIIVIILIVMNKFRSLTRAAIVGVWTASEEFCRSAQIDALIVYMDDDLDKAYIVMHGSGKILLNDTFDIKLGSLYGIPPTIRSTISIDCEVFPDMSLNLDICRGIMEWYDDERTHALLYKDTIASDYDL